MTRHADAILKLSLALAVLLAGAGIGFYYGIYLPSQDIRRQGEAMAERQTHDDEATREAAQRAERERQVQQVYEDCVNSAGLAFKNHWSAACRAQNSADIAAFEDCADDWFSSEEGCRRRHPIRPERGCALPSQVAERITGQRDDAERQCQSDMIAARGG